MGLHFKLLDKFNELILLRGRDIGVLVFKKTGKKVGLANSLQVQIENPNSALNRVTGVGIVENHPFKRRIVLDGKPGFFSLRVKGKKEDKGSYHRPPRDIS